MSLRGPGKPKHGRKRPPSPPPTALAQKRNVIEGVIVAIKQNRLLAFAAQNPLTLDHFVSKGIHGFTPLHKAAAYGRLDQVVQILNPTGAALSLECFLHKDSKGETPLHEAAASGSLNQVTAILNAAGQKLTLEQILLKSTNGRTLLHKALSAGHFDQVLDALKESGQRPALEHFLLKNGAKDRTPLELACHCAQLNRLFAPALWTGRVGEMEKLWQYVPEPYRRQVDHDQVVKEAILLGLPQPPKWEAARFTQAVSSVNFGDRGRDLSKNREGR